MCQQNTPLYYGHASLSTCSHECPLRSTQIQLVHAPWSPLSSSITAVWLMYAERSIECTLGFCDRASWVNCEEREKTNKMQQSDVYYQHCLNMFRTSLYPSSGEQDVCYCMWCAALVLLDVVGSGCVQSVTFTVLAPHNAAPHNRYQPHPAEP